MQASTISFCSGQDFPVNSFSCHLAQMLRNCHPAPKGTFPRTEKSTPGSFVAAATAVTTTGDGQETKTGAGTAYANAAPVILCIGTDRSTGDSLGPLIGYLLEQKHGLQRRCNIYGTLQTPIHALNLLDTVKHIDAAHAGAPIICVDASLGTPDRIGSITLSQRPLRPGLGVNKSLPSIGDISITGVIGTVAMSDPCQLQSIRLCMIMQMASNIAEGIAKLFSNDKGLPPQKCW